MKTIEDVAAEAGVSRSTASRALSGHPSVHPETRAKVQAAARKLSYQVDSVARSLRAGSSGLIGVVLTNLANSSIQLITTTIQNGAHAGGYEALVATTRDDAERERDIVNRLRGHRVDGLIIMGTGGNTTMLNDLDSAGFPVVATIRLPRGVQTSAVVYDDRRAGELACGELVAQGHRAIAFVGGPASTRSGRERYAGYQRCMRDAGIAVADTLVQRGSFEADFGAESISSLFEGRSRPTAVVLANHEASSGAMQEIARLGIDIPNELSVVAIEDSDLLRFWHPAITVVDTNPETVGELALAQLIDRLAGGVETGTRTTDVVDVRLIARSSVAAPQR